MAVLGTLKNRSVVCPLFSAFGPEPVRQRLDLGDGRMLVTTPALYRRKVAAIRDLLPRLEHVVLVGDAGGDGDLDGAILYQHLMADASDAFTIPPTDPEDMALLHFTSGTTGTPKGAVHVHEAVVAHHATATSALDLHPDDVFWCTADPGWVTGTSYGIIAPLTHGVTCLVDEGDFDADRWYRILAEQRVTVWYTAPDRPADAHASRGRDRPGVTTCRTCASSPASASRSTPRPCVWGAGDPGAAPSTTTGGRPRPAAS